MSQGQYESIQWIRARQVRQEDVFHTRQRTLTCGHNVDQSIHHNNSTPTFET
jgi:hypothetical protein